MKHIPIFLALVLLLTTCAQQPKEDLTLQNLQVEALTNPLGIDTRNPRLSWEIRSPQRGVTQTAYHILVAGTPEVLAENRGDLWDSGKVTSGASIQVPYEGTPLDSRTDCYWKVKIWSEHGASDWSRPAHWSMGLLYYNDWKGRWIGFDREFPWDDVSEYSRLSARYFRKEFDITNTVRSARAHIIGLGFYDLYINGQKVGDQALAPVPTDYSKNVKYNTFDVTGLLNDGSNAIGITLGNGLYFTMRQHYKPYKIKNFGFPKALLQLEIEYTDGRREVITTDDSWRGTADGPIRSNNIYDGEEYDARKEMPGWNTPGFDDSPWLPAEYVQEPFGSIEAQLTGNMQVMDTLRPVSVHRTGPGRYVLDMGQNMTGWVQMQVQGPRGQRVQLRFAEILGDDGNIFTANLRDARATDVYILKGGERETWAPHFIYHGFRYVEITGYPGTPAVEDFRGMMVYDRMATAGHLETSSDMLNQIYHNAWWGIAGNYKGVPVDCPQRDERMPWLGDRAVGAYGESYLFDNYRLYSKWLDDIRYAQKDGGALPDVAPPYFNYYSDNMTWPGTYLQVADMLYTRYGDTRVLRQNYPAMKKWLQYMRDQYMTADYIVTKDSYGDWCAPPATIEEGRGMSANVKHPSALIATAYYYHFMHLMADFAGVLGYDQDIPQYQALGEQIREGFNNRFYHQDVGYYGENTLTDNLLALYFGLVPREETGTVFHTVEQIILERNHGHLSTGLVGTQWLMRTLTQNGRPDIALMLAGQTTYPSWGYMVEHGATTIWELWNGNTAAPDMNSYNHVMLLGDLLTWYYQSLAGIKADREQPGFRHIIMRPEFSIDLNEVDASYRSLYGPITSHWHKSGNQLRWAVSIPANTTATLHFPVGKSDSITEQGMALSGRAGVNKITAGTSETIVDIGSGEYVFSVNSTRLRR